ncbi:hypothetical protein [Halohasta litorea]|uniref:Uncharacterized protein n=1 Tax=Halohasta litorea TaxID=869891 RepID=A0ABD6D9I5_9EURY|nr:hypothetical protein [Halohasta litorea]
MRLPQTLTDRSAHTEGGDESTAPIQQLRARSLIGRSSVEAVGFWAAVVLPVPTLLVLVVGVGTITELGVFSGLLTANLLAFYIGHGHSRPESESSH